MHKVLVVFAREQCRQLDSRAASLPIEVCFADTLLELSRFVQAGHVFQAAVLPATLPEEITWWELCGELLTLPMRPEILVCTQTASFRLWSSVLDTGGYDVITNSFSPEDLENALLQACAKFHRRVNCGEVNEEK